MEEDKRNPVWEEIKGELGPFAKLAGCAILGVILFMVVTLIAVALCV